MLPGSLRPPVPRRQAQACGVYSHGLPRTLETNGWTGGQWSLLRVVSALALAVYVVHQAVEHRWSGMERLFFGALALLLVALLLVGAGATLAVVLALGLLSAIRGPDVFISVGSSLGEPPSPALWPWVLAFGLWAWALLVSPAPYGSLAARKRPDPGGGWHLPFAWALLARASCMAYALATGVRWAHRVGLAREAGWTRSSWMTVWDLGLLLLVGTSHLLPRVRPWVWSGCLALLLAAVFWAPAWVLEPAAGLTLVTLAFDPGWIRPSRPGTTDWLFYDGDCGLCHASVRFVLAEDRSGSAFRFAPIDGAAWRKAFPPGTDAPRNTVVVRTAQGETLVRASAGLYVARRLGGLWRVLGTLAWVVPRPLRDLAYRGIARIRHLLFRAPSGACPPVSPYLLTRFDLRPAPPST